MRKSADELYHAWLKKGEKAKYIAKVYVGKGKYRYFYNNLEYKAYLAKQKLTKKVKETAETAEKKISKALGINTVQKIDLMRKMKLSELNDPMISKGKYAVKKWNTDRTIKDAVEKFKYIAKVEMPNGVKRYFYNIRTLDSFYNRKKYQENEPDFMKDVPEIKGMTTRDQDMAEINEQYKEAKKNGDWKRTHNCMLCSIAYELRRRGYDVEAADSEKYTNPVQYRLEQHTTTGMYNAFENPKLNVCNTADELLSKLSTQPNTRGILNTKYKDTTGGHSVVYEVDDNGKVTLRDCQTNTTYSSTKSFYESYLPKVSLEGMDYDRNYSEIDGYLNWFDAFVYTRTDNLKLNKGVLDVVRNN